MFRIRGCKGFFVNPIHPIDWRLPDISDDQTVDYKQILQKAVVMDTHKWKTLITAILTKFCLQKLAYKLCF